MQVYDPLLAPEQDLDADPANWLPTCTARVEALGCQETLFGTGFIFGWRWEYASGTNVRGTGTYWLVTNKHVIANSHTVRASLKFASSPWTRNRRGLYDNTVTRKCEFTDLSELVVNHPDEDVDLCAININGILNAAGKEGLRPANAPLTEKHFPTAADMESVRHIEPIVMIGYPNALWDSVNDAPIVRRGSTATDPLVPYMGREAFYVDISSLRGSSGSPIFILYDGVLRDGSLGTHALLIGILSEGATYKLDGKIGPAAATYKTGIDISVAAPMHLGYAISFLELNKLREAVMEKVKASLGKTK